MRNIENLLHKRLRYTQSLQATELINVKDQTITATNKRKASDLAVIEFSLCESLLI